MFPLLVTTCVFAMSYKHADSVIPTGKFSVTSLDGQDSQFSKNFGGKTLFASGFLRGDCLQKYDS